MIVEMKQWVKLKLIQHPKYRDSNERLYYQYLKELDYDIDNKSAIEFLKDMSNRKIPYIDSIARVSRLVQEEFPNLRGKFWGKRKIRAVKVKHELKNEKRKR